MTSSVTIVDEVVTFTVEQPRQTVSFEVCQQGPPGPPGPIGPAGDAPSIVAAVDLGGHRVIAANADGEGVYADQSDNTALAVQGISVGAAVAGDSCVVVRGGALAYPASGLTPDLQIFLGASGLMTQTPPATGWLKQVGFAIDADTISVEFGPAYWLGA